MKFNSLIVVKRFDAPVIKATEKAWPRGTRDSGFRAGFDWGEVSWVLRGPWLCGFISVWKGCLFGYRH